jgi:hypothetical protein
VRRFGRDAQALLNTEMPEKQAANTIGVPYENEHMDFMLT